MIKIFTVLCSILIAVPSYAGCVMMMSGSGSSAAPPAAPPAACTTQISSPTDMETYASYFSNFATSSSADDWASSMFVAGEDATICSVCFYVATSTGTSPTYNVTAYLYSNNTTPTPDQPNASSGAFETKNMTGVLTSAYQWICWTGGSIGITNTTIYHVVLAASGTDATNIMRWGKDATCASENVHRSGDGSTWTSTDTGRCGMLKLYKE